jgi:hypothetical protein
VQLAAGLWLPTAAAGIAAAAAAAVILELRDLQQPPLLPL